MYGMRAAAACSAPSFYLSAWSCHNKSHAAIAEPDSIVLVTKLQLLVVALTAYYLGLAAAVLQLTPGS